MGRLTATLDDELLEQARIATGTRTKRETIEAALHDVVRRAKARKALEHKGKIDLGFDRNELLRRRNDS